MNPMVLFCRKKRGLIYLPTHLLWLGLLPTHLMRTMLQRQTVTNAANAKPLTNKNNYKQVKTCYTPFLNKKVYSGILTTQKFQNQSIVHVSKYGMEEFLFQ